MFCFSRWFIIILAPDFLGSFLDSEASFGPHGLWVTLAPWLAVPWRTVHTRSHVTGAFSGLLNFFRAQGDYCQLASIPVLAPKCGSSFYCDVAFPLG